MERRYLAATLALIATFAIFSREFRSGRMDKLPCSRAELQADVNCAKRYLAERLAAKLRPLVDRGVPEEAQMVAELDLPVLAAVNVKIAEAQAAAAQKTAEKNCDRALRAQDATRRAQETAERAEEVSARAVERAGELSARASERAQQITDRANERAQELSVRTNERAVEIKARAIEQAQRAIERSRSKMVQPKVEHLPIPITFEVMTPQDFALPVQAAVESRLATESVKEQVATQQLRIVTVQRANQKMLNDVRVIVNRQDVSSAGLSQLSAARLVSRQIERAIQHFLRNLLRILERTFATV